MAAVAALPERQRDAIVLREMEGRTYDEIASRAGRERRGGAPAAEPRPQLAACRHGRGHAVRPAHPRAARRRQRRRVGDRRRARGRAGRCRSRSNRAEQGGRHGARHGRRDGRCRGLARGGPRGWRRPRRPPARRAAWPAEARPRAAAADDGDVDARRGARAAGGSERWPRGPRRGRGRGRRRGRAAARHGGNSGSGSARTTSARTRTRTRPRAIRRRRARGRSASRRTRADRAASGSGSGVSGSGDSSGEGSGDEPLIAPARADSRWTARARDLAPAGPARATRAPARATRAPAASGRDRHHALDRHPRALGDLGRTDTTGAMSRRASRSLGSVIIFM